MSGFFLVFEGGDGVGKTTQVQLLVQRLQRLDVPYTLTRQPGGSPLGEQIRGLLLDPAQQISARAEALLYAADKAHHVETLVRPALERGEIVVCDRYVDSMIAYQGAGRALDIEEVERLGTWATGALVPDLTVLLDAEPTSKLDRIHAKDRLEGAGHSFHARARQHFLDLAARDSQRYVVLDANRTREELAEQIWACIGPQRGLA